MAEFLFQRLGLMTDPDDPREAEGVLNPAAARGPDGQLYLFPRMVARGNYSRIGIARVRFDEAGDPVGVERLGVALEPEADYERLPDGGGGCEDPRVTFVEPLQRYLMTYTALSSKGPRIALALSEDLFHWRRLGLASFSPFAGIDFDGVDDKDASVFPVAISDPFGQPSIALIHRPLFTGSRPEETVTFSALRGVDLHRESIWISYCPVPTAGADSPRLGQFTSHHRLASPVASWERLKIGVGTPPILTRHGWLILYHGVHDLADPNAEKPHLCYSAGVMILSESHPRFIRHRSPEPVLTPKLPRERQGTIADVVFPTGIDRRDDLGTPERFDVYYGMADDRIGAARLDVPDFLPTGALADAPGAKV
jgi:predicted GH43/DUF377 family glycosyl hydrolase